MRVFLIKSIKDFLNNNEVFTKKELILIFGDKTTVEQLKLCSYLRQTSDCRWRKTDKLNELLADGVEEIKTETI